MSNRGLGKPKRSKYLHDVKPTVEYLPVVLLMPLFDKSHQFCVCLFLTVEGHSIYIRNLPINFTVAQLEAEFAKFGPIKQNGVQVRSKEVSHTVGFLLHCSFLKLILMFISSVIAYLAYAVISYPSPFSSIGQFV